MTKKEFTNLITENIIILDGATGTQLQKRGMPKGVCPEQWVIEHPEVIIDIQKQYIEAGSNIVYTCSFGGNSIKLGEFGLGDKVVEINKQLAQLSKQAADGKAFVAGDLAPTGKFIKPIGDMEFEQVVDIYKLQVQGLLEGGVDLFIIETMMDIQEARAALLAVKETCSLPVIVSMTFEENGYTLTGIDPLTALVTLQSLGADAVGCNCSTGPQDMIKIIKELKRYAKVPLLAKPNAGMPELIDGITVFNMDSMEFGSFAKDFAEAGVNIIGGCCGTDADYISQLLKNIVRYKPVLPTYEKLSILSSSRKTVCINQKLPLTIVGERINPTGKENLQNDLKVGATDEIFNLAREQIEDGAHILDVNVGMPGIDEKQTLTNVVEFLSNMVDVPLCIDSSSPEAIEAALRIYPGRALINSISAEKNKLEELLPVAVKYGAMFILLPLNNEGVPQTSEKRIKLIKEVFEKAKELGYEKQDIIVDGLVMTVSSEQQGAMETLKVIDWCSNNFGCNTIVGLSNISFGLPQRDLINGAFLSMAASRGLTMAIANPSNKMFIDIKMASDVLMSRDIESRKYIKRFSDDINVIPKEKNNSVSDTQQIYNCVLAGDKDGIVTIVKSVLKQEIKPSDIVDKHLIPAITEVGELYEKGKYFLPQLISSAEAMKNAFAILEPLLQKDKNNVQDKVKVVLATVKGDVHDIGKNIVALMLKNHGFEIYDIGKDVEAQQIIKKAREVNAEVVGLSALMTTTMTEMKKTIELAKQEGLKCKFMIGGAPVNKKYADEIGADGYSEDAHSAVKLAKKLAGRL